MRRGRWLGWALILALLTACGAKAPAASADGPAKTGSMELQYAQRFSVDYYEGGYAAIDIADGSGYLLAPEGSPIPETLGQRTVIRQPAEHIYVASSSAMDLFLRCGALDAVTMTSTDTESWTIPEIRQAMERGDMTYVGKYSAPDYEYVLDEGCTLALENTMIYHSPDAREKLQKLGIPVLVENSSYEPHPLGRVEWIKLYGLLTGHLDQAEDFFRQSVQQVEAVEGQAPSGRSVAFFYISASGGVKVRSAGDYIPKMIALAGGTYAFSDQTQDSGARSTVDMEMERFYTTARDADILIYNSTVGGELETLEDLLQKAPMLGDARAVKSGDVWCTEQNMFQQVSGTADMISDLHQIISGTAGDGTALTFLHRLK